MNTATKKGETVRWLREAVDARASDCVIWPYSTDDGYGVMWFHGRLRKAHHVALILVGREPPRFPLESRHVCGVRLCVNPNHLLDGTRSENEADKVWHGRSNRGERHRMAKLTEEQVREIRRLYVRGKPRWGGGNSAELAARYGVSRDLIQQVANGRRWRHL